eukprot:TRINITY_DN8440_c0_g1_i2.p1 TRINITY_DN8440_c0_g1~~TRINITY_DN8440_c0_g1_i2.p1  ORF type:complete len:1332 (+),score=223.92 TRINITY_DN8440_c0_g1_i2:99-4094(+)
MVLEREGIGRTLLLQDENGEQHEGPPQQSHGNHSFMRGMLHDLDGRAYRDYYLTVCENLKIDSVTEIRKKLKHFFRTYPQRVHWHTNLPSHYPCPCHSLSKTVETEEEDYFKGMCLLAEENPYMVGRNSSAEDGNLLEMINLAISVLDCDYVDRSLDTTGSSVVVISAGNGVFNVHQGLVHITEARAYGKGIACDFVSLAPPPAHVVPLFVYYPLQYKGVQTDSELDMNTSEFFLQRDTHKVYRCAQLIYAFFFDGSSDTISLSRKKDEERENTTLYKQINSAGFNPTFYIPSLQSMSASDRPHLGLDQKHFVPVVPSYTLLQSQEEFLSHDAGLFKCVKTKTNKTPKIPTNQPPPKGHGQGEAPVQTPPLTTSSSTSSNKMSQEAKQRELQRQLQIEWQKAKNPGGSPKQDSTKTESDTSTTPKVPRSTDFFLPVQDLDEPDREMFGEASGSLIQNYLGRKVMAELFGEEIVEQPDSGSTEKDEGTATGYGCDEYLINQGNNDSDDEFGDSRMCINPFKGNVAPPPPKDKFRWAHIFHRISAANECTEESPSGSGQHWQSLAMPASLPVTCSYFPTYDLLETKHTELPHVVIPRTPIYKENPLLLLSELVALRLDLHYQIVTKDTRDPCLPHLPDAKEALLEKAVYMSGGDSFIVLYIDTRNQIRVRNFLRVKPSDGLWSVNRRGSKVPSTASSPAFGNNSRSGLSVRTSGGRRLPLITSKENPTTSAPVHSGSMKSSTNLSLSGKHEASHESADDQWGSTGKGISITKEVLATFTPVSAIGLGSEGADGAGSGNWSVGSTGDKSRLAQRGKDALTRLKGEAEREEVRGRYEYNEGNFDDVEEEFYTNFRQTYKYHVLRPDASSAPISVSSVITSSSLVEAEIACETDSVISGNQMAFSKKDLPYYRLSFFLVPEEDTKKETSVTNPTPASFSSSVPSSSSFQGSTMVTETGMENDSLPPITEKQEQEDSYHYLSQLQDQYTKNETIIRKFKEFMKYLSDRVDNQALFSEGNVAHTFEVETEAMNTDVLPSLYNQTIVEEQGKTPQTGTPSSPFSSMYTFSSVPLPSGLIDSPAKKALPKKEIKPVDLADNHRKRLARIDLGKTLGGLSSTVSLSTTGATPTMATQAHATIIPNKGNRYEWINVVYDTTFSPQIIYEFEIQWVSCSSSLIVDLLNALNRRARQCGFILQQVASDDVDLLHPFRFSYFKHFQLSFLKSISSHVYSEANGIPETDFPTVATTIHKYLVTVLDFIPRRKPYSYSDRTCTIFLSFDRLGFSWKAQSPHTTQSQPSRDNKEKSYLASQSSSLSSFKSFLDNLTSYQTLYSMVQQN